jgi:molybdopterin converting factor small subunit
MGIIRVLFFGKVADILGARVLEVSSPIALMALRGRLLGELFSSGALNDAQVLMSVNQVLVTQDQTLSDEDEVAFFSAFSGG